MIKASIEAAALLVLAPVAAFARPAAHPDGCAVLASLVKDRVYLAATELSMKRERDLPRSRIVKGRAAAAPRHVCDRTAEITTRAFGEALAILNMAIGWEPPNPGDYCLSGDLSQCYPGLEPGDPRLPASQIAFVYDAWRGVRDAVRSQMPAGSARGVAVFSTASLDAALALRLGQSVEGPLWSSYRAR
jgi:hypothetical protein